MDFDEICRAAQEEASVAVEDPVRLGVRLLIASGARSGLAKTFQFGRATCQAAIEYRHELGMGALGVLSAVALSNQPGIPNHQLDLTPSNYVVLSTSHTTPAGASTTIVASGSTDSTGRSGSGKIQIV